MTDEIDGKTKEQTQRQVELNYDQQEHCLLVDHQLFENQIDGMMMVMLLVLDELM